MDTQLEKDIRRIESLISQSGEWIIAVPHNPMGSWSYHYVPTSNVDIFTGTEAEATRTFDRKYVEQYNYTKNTDYVSMHDVASMEVGSQTREWIDDVRNISSETGGTCDDTCGVCPLTNSNRSTFFG